MPGVERHYHGGTFDKCSVYFWKNVKACPCFAIIAKQSHSMKSKRDRALILSPGGQRRSQLQGPNSGIELTALSFSSFPPIIHTSQSTAVVSDRPRLLGCLSRSKPFFWLVLDMHVPRASCLFSINNLPCHLEISHSQRIRL